MRNFDRFLQLLRPANAVFKPYFERENELNRLLRIHAIGSFIIGPIFAWLIYNTEVSQTYFYIVLSYTLFFPFYAVLALIVEWMRDKLMYLFIIHLFAATCFGFWDLYMNRFSLEANFAFYALFTVVLFMLQRLIPALLYVCFLFIAILYGFSKTEHPEMSFFAAVSWYVFMSLVAITVLYARERMINAVEYYSFYQSQLANANETGNILFDIKNDEITVIDSTPSVTHVLESAGTSCKNPRDFLSKCLKEEIKDVKKLNRGGSFEFIHETSSKRYIELIFSNIELKNTTYYLAQLKDCTNRIREAELLKVREEKYRNLYQRNQAGVFTLHVDSEIIDFNESFAKVFGSHFTIGKHLFSSDNKDTWRDIVDLLRRTNKLSNYQTNFWFVGSEPKRLVFNLYLDNSTETIEGSVIEITDIVKANEAIQSNERKYRLLFEESNDAVLLLENGKILEVNRKGLQLFAKSEKEIVGANIVDLSFHQQEDLLSDFNRQLERLRYSKTIKFNWQFQVNQAVIETELVFAELVFNDKIYQHCIIHDMTEINRYVREIDNSKKSFQSLLENNPEGIIVIDKDSNVLYSNPQLYLLTGTDNIHLNQLFKGDDQLEFNELLKRFWENGEQSSRELFIQTENKANILVELTLNATNFNNDLALLLIFKDISIKKELSREQLRAELAEENNQRLEQEVRERKQAEQLLADLLLKTQAIYDSSSNTFLFTLDKAGLITYFNSHCDNFLFHFSGVHMREGEYYRDYFNKIFSDENLNFFESKFMTILQGNSVRIEGKLQRNNQDHWVEMFINPIYNRNGKIQEVSVVAHEITDKKQFEHEIKSSLKEKEILLKEIHHRVKNNMQIISSILNLQSSFVTDQNTLEILQDSRNRIRTMAMIHENLYKTDDFNSINFTNYIETLSRNILLSYQIGQTAIELDFDFDRLSLVLDQAIPAGLIMNELITNAIKYAYKEEATGKIYISVKVKKNRVELGVRDDGAGLPTNFNIVESESLGLQLVHTLVEQLEGNIHFTNQPGCQFLITFEKTKH